MLELLDVAAPVALGDNMNVFLATLFCAIPVIIIIIVIITINKKKISKQEKNLEHSEKNN